MRPFANARTPVLRLAGLTAAALVINGYHLGVEDAEIYLPAARWFRHPALYPFGREFFLSHARLSLFAPLVAGTGYLTHLSMDWTFFAWYLVTLFATIWCSWLMAAACFNSSRARWSAVLLMTAVIGMPVANTGLLLIDPYLTARSFSTPLTLLAVALVLERRFAWAAIAVVLTAVIHPQMSVYLLFLIVVLWAAEVSRNRVRARVPAMASAILILPQQFHFSPASGPYREALFSRDYFFLYNWSWYHWLGLLGPLVILVWFWRANLRGTRPAFKQISFALIPLGLLSIVAAAILCSTPDLQMFVRLQPLRSYDLIYLIFVLLLGGVAGEFLAKIRWWVTPAVLLSLALGMYGVARCTYPHSSQIELPSSAGSNPWVKTLFWIRRNTPANAVFAVDSRYFKDPVVDVHGFRAISERSELADYYKDGGVVSLFPDLAVRWKDMSAATYGLNHFSITQFQGLKREYPAVTGTVIHGLAPAGMDCPYQQGGFSVCRMPESTVAAIDSQPGRANR